MNMFTDEMFFSAFVVVKDSGYLQ